MPALSRKRKREETRTLEELALLSAMNSEYNIMHPMVDANYVRVRNPLTGRDPLFQTDSNLFRELIMQLCEKGLDIKLAREFDEFSVKYNTKWSSIKEFAMRPATEAVVADDVQ